MLKKSHGNMYDWVTHMHSHLGGICPHKCSYCYVQRNIFGINPRYQGDLRLSKHELMVDYGKDKTIFIEYMNDMFANKIEQSWIFSILNHCYQYPKNEYVFQTKNPERAHWYLASFPPKFMIGTTIESNRCFPQLTDAPIAEDRYRGLLKFRGTGQKTFITIEPILNFDVDILMEWIKHIQPNFVNIGADSKNCALPEPSAKKVWQLINELQDRGIHIKKKINLERLLK